ncbi:MAG: tRNA (adenosine(37)-N6)-threonylcarbamoyltransferase complex dimerization subunit type 1 TsaB [Eubacteriaceae bacterium]|nr:tRNA (adenosine(37)-N6)-threonylcarbamoyltransferase complex dimerization subunit type 1 TsaB [Eubacteriaceae bacterium]
MYILAIETTGPLGSVAIIDENGKIKQAVSGEEMNHLKDLMPMAQRLTSELGITPGDLTAVAASVGPGSFTGIRIGVSTARALSQALGIPAAGVKTLDSFKLKCRGSRVIVPIFNARRGQVYGGVFGENGEDILPGGPYMLEDVLSAIKTELEDRFDNTNCGMPVAAKVVFYGDGIDAYEERLDQFTAELKESRVACVIEKAEKEERYQCAAMTAQAALEMYKQGKTVSVEELLPDYMRTTEAEQKLKDGTLARERKAKMERLMSGRKNG